MNPQALNDLKSLYEELDRELNQKMCGECGECCDFPKLGEVLYATMLEVTYFFSQHEFLHHSLDGLCPWWSNKTCLARKGRPLGCRLYFCDREWLRYNMSNVSERYHKQLRDIHDKHCLKYVYRPFLELIELPLIGESATSCHD